MKLITAMSTAALVLVPAVGFAQDPGNGAQKEKEPSVVEKVIGTITGRSPDTKKDADAKSGDRDSAAKSAGDKDYPDRGAIKRTDK
jgi:hypothetical protein